jgi:hypothetical protein
MKATKKSTDKPKKNIPFGGKKAAPFVKGGGRSKTQPNTAKGTPKKQAAAPAKKKR